MNSDSQSNQPASLLEKLHNQTAQISWRELQRYFAQGKVLRVDADLDLVQIASALAEDNINLLTPLIEQQLIAAPSDDRARHWYEADTLLWSVVVAPYVLVQDKAESRQHIE